MTEKACVCARERDERRERVSLVATEAGPD